MSQARLFKSDKTVLAAKGRKRRANRMRNAQLYWERRNAGLCGACGGKLDDPKFALCASCREKRREASVYEREARRQRGLCIRCGRSRDKNDSCYCAACRGAKKLWEEKRKRYK